MKSIAALVLLTFTLSACGSSSNEFIVRNGLCYRVRTERTLGVQTHQETVLALPANCGL